MWSSALVILFVSNLVYVGLKAFQQRNVALDHDKAVLGTSLALGQAEIFLVGTTAAVFINAETVIQQMAAGFVLGVAGGIGALVSMRMHKKWLKS